MTNRHYFTAGLLALGLTLVIGAWQWNLLHSMNLKTDALESQMTSLTSLSQNLASDYQTVKSTAAAARQSSAQALASVFPDSEDVTGLTRLLDDFAVKTNFENNPFFVSNMKFGAAAEVENGLSFIPVSLTLNTSRKNLSKFLEMIEQSGSLEAGVRLMSVDDLSIAYPKDFGGSLDVQMTLNAYFSSL